MKTRQFLRGVLVALATVGLVIPGSLVQAATGVPAMQTTDVVRDVALQDGGVLHGQVVNAQGAAQPGVTVAVESHGQTVATATTNEQGFFRAAGLRGGIHVVRTQQYAAAHRLWAPHTAPPAASRGLLIVDSPDVANANVRHLVDTYGVGALLVGGAIGAVVAIAIDRDGS